MIFADLYGKAVIMTNTTQAGIELSIRVWHPRVRNGV